MITLAKHQKGVVDLNVAAQISVSIRLYPDFTTKRGFCFRKDKISGIENQKIGVTPDYAGIAFGQTLLQTSESCQIARNNSLPLEFFSHLGLKQIENPVIDKSIIITLDPCPVRDRVESWL